jgi:superfamily II DNA helicase RecQ
MEVDDRPLSSVQATVEEVEDVQWSGLAEDLPEPLYPTLLSAWTELFHGLDIQPKPIRFNIPNAFLLRQDTILCAPTRLRDKMMAESFSSCVSGLIIDHAHTVKDWVFKVFRKQYRHLGHKKNQVS